MAATIVAPAGAWQPSDQGVADICLLLRQHLQPGPDQGRAVLQELERCSQIADFGNYLAYILCVGMLQGQPQPVEVRQAAGLLLKNQIKTKYAALAPQVQEYVRLHVLRSIGADDKHVRATVGSVVSAIVETAGLQTWPDLLQGIAQCLDSNDYNHVEGALDALNKMCEDDPTQLDSDIPGLPDRPINAFFPRLLRLLGSEHANFRRLSLGCINQFLVIMPKAFVVNMDAYLQGLVQLASDPSGQVRRLVCSAFVQMVEMRADYLQPHIRSVVEYMLRACQDQDADVALEAAEFWSAFCESQQPPEVLREFLPQLMAALLTNMAYADDDETLVEAEEEGNAPDSDQNIRPRFHHSKMHGGGGGGENGEEDGGDADDDDDEDATVWNLRKASASGLDTLSHTFGDELLPFLMPLIQVRLADKSEDKWREREAGILAIGAISDGCIGGLLPAIPQMVSHLLPMLDDPKPLIRSIACWTLSRYSRWIVMAADSPDGQGQFDAVLTGILARVLDNNKKVQEAACSAFATLEEEAVELLPQRLEPILQHLMFAFGKYQRRNQRILYDAIGTLAECVGGELQNPQHVAVLMPPLTAKWQQLADHDKDLFPLLECLTSISQALGPAFTPYAEPVFGRCCHIIRLQLAAKANPAQAGTGYEREFIVCCLDLLSGIADALGAAILPLVLASQLVDVLLQCSTAEENDVRQSSFALIGDLAKSCPEQLRPRLGDVLNLCVAQLQGPEAFNIDRLSVANNACWAIGEIAVKLKGDVAPVVIPLMSAIVPVLAAGRGQGSGSSRALVENSAITLGRVAWVCPTEVAPHLPHFLQPWAASLRSIRDDVEKEDAFKGLCAVLRLNPMAATNCLPVVLAAVGSWKVIHSEPLKLELAQLLQGFKQALVDAGTWEQFKQGLDPQLAAKLSSEYGI